jgi:hypothetical protein
VSDPAPAQSDGESKSPEAPKPFDLEEAMAKEFSPLARVELEDPAGTWTSRIESVGVPTIKVETDGPAEITVPVGTLTDVKCYVYQKTMDVAATVLNMFRLTESVVSYKQIVPTLVDIVAGSAMLQTNGLYTLEQNNMTMVGLFKLILYAHPQNTIMCIHDEPGYNNSFLRVVKGLFEDFKTNSPVASSDLEEIWTIHLGNLPVGFANFELSKNNDKTYSSTRQTTMIIPRSHVDLSGLDTWEQAHCDKNGYIIDKKNISSEAGEITINIDLKRTKKGSYSYSGSVKEKPLKGVFKTRENPGLLLTHFLEKRASEILAKGGEETFSTQTYSPGMEPEKPMDVKYEVKGKDSPKTLLVHMGELVLNGTADDEGKINQLVMPIGNAELVMKLAYSKGSL